MKSENQNVERETVRLTCRLHMPAGAQFGRYRLLVEGDLGQRGLVRVCRSKAELAACLRHAISERRQARRDRRVLGLVDEALRAQSQGNSWFVAQEWIGSAFQGTWQDVAARELQRR